MNVNFIIAFTAGIVSFLSPCVFPVIPSYLTYIGGVSLSDIEENRKNRTVLLLNSLLFVLGFTIIFTVLGVFFSGVGIALSGAATYINMGAGVIVALLGLNFIFDFWKMLNLEKRFHFKKRPGGAVGSIFLGMAFGAGWTPCIGPILASILFLASGSGSVGRGALLLIVYSVGLGLPFIAAGLFISRFKQLFSKLGKHLHTIKVISGIFLILIGVLIFTGRLNRINILLFRVASQLEYMNEIYPGRVGAVSGLILLVPVILLAISIIRKIVRDKRDNLSINDAQQILAENDKAIPENSGDDAVQRKITLPIGRTIWLLIFLIPAVLIFVGVLDMAGLLVSWLTFQGL